MPELRFFVGVLTLNHHRKRKKEKKIMVDQAAKIGKSKDFPIELHIDVTNHCNAHCSMCPMRNRYKQNLFPMGYMDYALYGLIIEECSQYHTEHMEINLHKDGEPLLHPRIIDFIELAKSKDFFVHFGSNGLLLDEKGKAIINSGLDLLTISITNGYSAMPSVKRFMEYKGIGTKPITQIKIFQKFRAHDLPTVDKVILRNIHTWTDSEDRNSQQPCSKLLYNPAITWDGYLSLCCVDYKREGFVGNIKDRSIYDMWKDIRCIWERQQEGFFTNPCIKCNYIDEIGGY